MTARQIRWVRWLSLAAVKQRRKVGLARRRSRCRCRRAEASVELADELVAECSVCLSVGLAGGALPVVERAAAR